MTPDPETSRPATDASSDPAPDATDRATPALPWPPPGLGRIQGDAYVVARWLAGGAVLVLPLLWAVATDQGPWSLGPLGETLWLAALLAIIGIPVLMTGYVFLNRLLRRATRAARNGYGWRLIALAACDHRRDTGFLLQGARIYEVVEPARRRRLASARIWTGGLFLGAALWLSLGFALAVVLAARGLLGPAGVVWMTLFPTSAGLVCAELLYAWQESRLRAARKTWHGKPWSAELAATEIEHWKNALAEEHEDMVRIIGSGEGAPGTFRVAANAAIVVGLVAVVPIFFLIFASMLSPVIANLAVPAFDRTQAKRAQIEPLRRFTLEPDPSVTAHEAGAILHAVAFAGLDAPLGTGLAPPVRRYEEAWLPAPPDDDVMPGTPWAPTSFMELLEDPNIVLDPAALQYLEDVASHPGHADLARAARAAEIDLATPRWTRPLPAELAWPTLPIPRFSGIRDGAYAHLAKAALEARRGQLAAADTTLRELVSVGFRMAEQGPLLIDNLIGVVIAGIGGDGLERLYTFAGRPEAAELRGLRATVDRSVDMARVRVMHDPDAAIRSLSTLAVDTALVPGLRWEMYMIGNTLAPCLNPHRIVFGPDPSYQAWLEQIESTLVHTPGEAQLFELGQRGFVGGAERLEPGLGTRLMTLTMGGVNREGSCWNAISGILGVF